MLEFFSIHGVPLWKVFFQNPVHGHMGENARQILPVNVVKIIVDDIFDGNGESLENIQILGKGESSHLQGVGQQIQLALQLHRIDAVQAKGLVKQGESLINVVKRGPGDQAQIDLVHQLFEQHVDQGFDPEGKSQCIELAFVVTAVHGGDIDGNVAFFVYVRSDFVSLVGENDRL